MTGVTVCKGCGLKCDVDNIEYIGLMSQCCSMDVEIVNMEKKSINDIEKQINGEVDIFRSKNENNSSA